MKTKLLFTFLLTYAMAFAQGTGEVIITEFYNRPPKPSQEQIDTVKGLPQNAGSVGNTNSPDEGHGEWLEIYNTTTAPVVMDGWKLVDGSNNAEVIIESFTLEAGAYAIFAGYYIPELHGGIEPDYIYPFKKISLNNETTYSGGSETNCPDGVIIYNAADELVDQVLYDYGYGSYIYDDGLGDGVTSHCSNNPSATPFGFPGQSGSSKTSFMLKVGAPLTAAANDDPANWEYSTLTYDGSQKGTPGKANDQDATLSVTSFLASKLSVYPNPANDYITILSADVKISSAEIFSLLGQKVLSQNMSKNNRIDVSHLSKGIYMLKISSDAGSLTKKIIIE
ncbi:T9SS type A sorting domain-containing protein [Mariniflexile ostreae]|uniref:T9SS type A sorting domain-containing protein n=1 Tax=Mariniflexile ostreae TaxID=1520892 RepID=A0ABV5FEQ8_9FLAO